MKVEYRLIELGRVIGQQQREYDNYTPAVAKAIERDQYEGMDPAEQIQRGEPVRWVEARVGR
jgi:hypothetical protein